MILLLGGTSETAPIASLMASKGFRVLVSTATNVSLGIEINQQISIRGGGLNEEKMRLIVKQNHIKAIVDATHPYAGSITQLAQRMAEDEGIPFFRFSRPGVSELVGRVHLAEDHIAAAKIAFGFRRPVFVTTGSRNLAPYTDEAHKTGMPLIVRVLPTVESINACEEVGIPSRNIIVGKGPFSLEDNLKAIRKHNIGILVTKDSGKAGGVPQKLEAARTKNCEVVLVARPAYKKDYGTEWSDIPEMVNGISEVLTNNHSLNKLKDAMK